MFTVFVSVKPREFAAVKETSVEPSSWSAGSHSKEPEARSNVAPFGLFATTTDTGNPWSSTALTEKRTGELGVAVRFLGARR
ncbi:MAG: hypothetical protein JWO19_2355 [Bryobacterales bacterium]|nr:hypothetical protein [Bryobacterales bacterium]